METSIQVHQLLLKDFTIDDAAEYLRFRSKIGLDVSRTVPVRSLSYETQLKIFEYYGLDYIQTKHQSHIHFNDYDELMMRFQESFTWRLEAEGICQDKSLIITIIDGKMIVGHNGEWCVILIKG